MAGAPEIDSFPSCAEAPKQSVFDPPQAACPPLENIAEFTCRNTPFLIGRNESQRLAVCFRPRCKLWSCPHCAKINADLWTMRAVFGAAQLQEMGDTIDMVTVTAHERHSVSRAIACLPSQWNKLRNRWQREVAKPQYMLTAEVGAKGHFHIHFITNASPGTRFWKDAGRASGFGFMNKESEKSIHPERAGFYISKYLTKAIQENSHAKGYHRVRASHGWPKLPPLPTNDQWAFAKMADDTSLVAQIIRLRASGYRVAVAGPRSAWDLIETGELTNGGNTYII